MFSHIKQVMFNFGRQIPDLFGLIDQQTTMDKPSGSENLIKFKECIYREASKKQMVITERQQLNNSLAIYFPISSILVKMDPHKNQQVILDLLDCKVIHHGTTRGGLLSNLNAPDKVHNTKPFPHPFLYQYGNIFFLFPFAQDKNEATSQTLICVYQICDENTDKILLKPI